MSYRCFIVDDEPLAVDVIRTHLDKLKDFEVTGAYTDPIEAFSALKEQTCDLLFLDIEMPELTGLELARALERRPEVIFTTAYREYGVDGFDLKALDYLVKPISFSRFMQAIDRFLDKKSKLSAPVSEKMGEHIIVRADRKNIKVAYDDILYVEGLKDYVKIKLMNGELLTKESLGHFQDHLDPKRFLRVHKSFIVSKEKVTAFTHQDVEIGDIEIPIGRKYKEEVIRSLQ